MKGLDGKWNNNSSPLQRLRPRIRVVSPPHSPPPRPPRPPCATFLPAPSAPRAPPTLPPPVVAVVVGDELVVVLVCVVQVYVQYARSSNMRSTCFAVVDTRLHINSLTESTQLHTFVTIRFMGPVSLLDNTNELRVESWVSKAVQNTALHVWYWYLTVYKNGTRVHLIGSAITQMT